MKKIFLHVGAPKTGSSTIQSNLQHYYETISTLNIYYPIEFNDLFEYPHPGFISTGNVNPLAYAMRYNSDPLKYKDFEIHSVLETLGWAIENNDNVVLSHEDLIHAHVRFLTTICDWSKSNGYQVHPVILVRDQISWHVSNYQQHVRQLKTDKTFIEVLGRSLSLRAADWYNYITKFENVFGHDKLIVSLYDRNLIDGNIIQFFINQLGFKADFLQGLKLHNKNIGISPSAAVVTANFHKYSKDSEKQNKLLELLSQCDDSIKSNIVSREIANLIISYYKESNKKLCEKYLSSYEKEILESCMKTSSRQPDNIAESSLFLAGEVISKLL